MRSVSPESRFCGWQIYSQDLTNPYSHHWLDCASCRICCLLSRCGVLSWFAFCHFSAHFLLFKQNQAYVKSPPLFHWVLNKRQKIPSGKNLKSGVVPNQMAAVPRYLRWHKPGYLFRYFSLISTISDFKFVASATRERLDFGAVLTFSSYALKIGHRVTPAICGTFSPDVPWSLQRTQLPSHCKSPLYECMPIFPACCPLVNSSITPVTFGEVFDVRTLRTTHAILLRIVLRGNFP